ncbi:MAG: hypothetical protein JW712_07440 [Dehalococcoidales bacterium]|nr:hypothetical protein [Dehalococcoidales bacterium]
MRDYSLSKYSSVCHAINNANYSSVTFTEFLSAKTSHDKTIILRHDVDRKIGNALEMAKLEYEHNIKSTYYFRMNPSTFVPKIIHEIELLGHEIGYHYEVLDKAKGNYSLAYDIFIKELNEIRKVADVKSICMHGNPLTKWDNRDIWGKYRFQELGVVGEAYLSISDVIYLSDTGRTWNSKYKIKDWLPNNPNKEIMKISNSVNTTDDLIRLINTNKNFPLYILTHPERWNDQPFSWIVSYTVDSSVNLVKTLIRLVKIR